MTTTAPSSFSTTAANSCSDYSTTRTVCMTAPSFMRCDWVCGSSSSSSSYQTCACRPGIDLEAVKHIAIIVGASIGGILVVSGIITIIVCVMQGGCAQCCGTAPQTAGAFEARYGDADAAAAGVIPMGGAAAAAGGGGAMLMMQQPGGGLLVPYQPFPGGGGAVPGAVGGGGGAVFMMMPQQPGGAMMWPPAEGAMMVGAGGAPGYVPGVTDGTVVAEPLSQ